MDWMKWPEEAAKNEAGLRNGRKVVRLKGWEAGYTQEHLTG